MALLTRTMAIACALFASSAAFAQYPAKPIRLIVPFPPGGAAELSARIFAQPLSQQLGQPVVIETRPGADGAIASEAAKSAAADGYTLYYGTATGLSFVPAAKKKPTYDPIADFTPISLVGMFGFFVISNASLPVHTINDLVGYARANPGRIFYGSGNATSILATAQFAAQQGIDVTHVPYKGDGPLTVDLLAGRVQFAFLTPGSAAPHIQAGKLRALATMLPNRSALLPNAPTLPESGMPLVPITPWGGLFGPAKLPAEIVERVSREMAVVLAKTEVRDSMGKLAFEARSSSPAGLTAIVKEQLDAYRRAVQASKISLD